MKFLLRLLIISCIALLTSCRAIPPDISIPDPYSKPKDIAIFIDGTAFKQSDSSNIYKLVEKVKDRKDLLSFYTVGVGAGPDAKRVGQFLGIGLSVDVQNAYRFICENYSKTRQDRIHLFGFSRGAYTCKIVTNLMLTAGVINFENLRNQKHQKRLVRQLYKAYLSKKSIEERKQDVNIIIKRWEDKLDIKLKRRFDVTVETLNLFDTVEALGAPDGSFNPCCPNKNHPEQYSNIKKVNHAVSIDDNRARIFTPILATCPCAKDTNNRPIDDYINEVWFAGAHSDVGGGYKYENGKMDNKLAYIPLQWMMNNLKSYDLFEGEITLYKTNISGTAHDAEIDYGPAFLRRNRNLSSYLNKTSHYNHGKLKLHRSVITRLKSGLLPIFKHYEKKNEETDENGNHVHTKDCLLDWFQKQPFDKCFKATVKGYDFVEPCDTIEIID